MEELERKVDEVYIAVEKIRKYMLWTAIITLIVIVLPLVGLAVVLPTFISNYLDAFSTLGL